MLTESERQAKIELGLKLKRKWGPEEQAHRRYVMQGITFEPKAKHKKGDYKGHLNYKRAKPGMAGLCSGNGW